jgi:hypothetical protein
MAQKPKRAKVKLTKAIRIQGKGPVEAGKTLEVDPAFANDLVGANQAVRLGEDDEETEERAPQEKYGVNVVTPRHDDPGPTELHPKPKAR